MRTVRAVIVAGVVAVVVTSCAGDGDVVVEPVMSTTTTVAERDELDDLFREVDVDDEAADAAEASDAEQTGGDETFTEPASSGPSSSDGSTSDPVTSEPEATSGADRPTGTEADEVVSTAESGTTGGTTNGSNETETQTETQPETEVCDRVQGVADALAVVDAADASVGTSGGIEQLRAALDDAVKMLSVVEEIAPGDVVDDIALVIAGIELQIAVEFDGGQLTAEQLELLDGSDLEGATDRFAAFAVGTCGIEIGR